MDKQVHDNSCSGIAIKTELIDEDEPVLPTEIGEASAIVVKQEEELIIEDELPFAEEENCPEGAEPVNKAENLTCSICKQTFEKTYLLTRHIRAHQSESEQLGEFHCEFCGKMFTVKALYTKHLRRHRPHIFDCHLCEKTFPEKGILNGHLKYKHKIHTEDHKQNGSASAESLFHCEQCGKTFKKKRNYNEHARRHRIINAGLYRCISCEKSFKSRLALLMHKDSDTHRKQETPGVTPRVKPRVRPIEHGEFHCTVCDKVYHTRQSYTMHLLRHRPRNFHCHLCPKSFPVIGCLKRHLKHVHMVLSSTPSADTPSTDNRKEESVAKTIVKEEPVEDGSSSQEEDLLQDVSQSAPDETRGETMRCDACNKVYKYAKRYKSHMRKHSLGAKIMNTLTV